MPRNFTNWLAAYAEHTSISEAPASFHFWTGVSVLAGALRRRVWIDQRIFQWTPNFYIVLVGPPGVATKSTTMKIGFRLLRQVPGIGFGPQSMTWQGLLNALDEHSEQVLDTSTTRLIESGPHIGLPIDPVHARYLPMSCLTCDISELGTFLRPTNPDLTDFLIDMWDGQIGSWSRSLATKDNTHIENPWLNIIGCTTPSWLQNNFTESMIHGGLTSRCIFVWGDAKTQLISYPAEMAEDVEYSRREQALVEDLVEISQMLGPMTLSPEAITLGTQWYESHWSSRPAHLTSERFSGYIARKQTHIHKLAMILSAAFGESKIITEEILNLAIMSVTGVERDMLLVFNSISDTPLAKHIDEILTIIRRNKSIRRRTLYRKCLRQMSELDFNQALRSALSAGYLTSHLAKGEQVFTAITKAQQHELETSN